MGGDSFLHPMTSIGEELSQSPEFSHESMKSSFSREKDLSAKLRNGSLINEGIGLQFREFPDLGIHNSSIFESSERQKCKAYEEVLRSYENLEFRIERLEEAIRKILSYTPGSLTEKSGSVDLNDYNVPKVTTLLVIGPKSSGKSSLINKISRVLEDDIFASGRAQVSSYNSSTGDGGTYFLNEYLIPRGSGLFCLYDTRSLSDDSLENSKMVKHWMTKGVRHGELVMRETDSGYLKARLKYKSRRGCYGQVRETGFVIFVVNGISVLESMDDQDEANNNYTRMISTAFNDPLLSFKDDKPTVVVTHGDLLSLPDRARLRVHLGELLGVPPTTQIFDIPESRDSGTALTIVDMLYYCLEHADGNLSVKKRYITKKCTSSLVACLLLLMAVGSVIVLQIYGSNGSPARAPTDESEILVDWHKIRHLWSD